MNRNQILLSLVIFNCMYSVTSISSPGHYLFPGAMEMTLRMHGMIWVDAIAGLSLLGFILWSAAILREWSTVCENSLEGMLK